MTTPGRPPPGVVSEIEPDGTVVDEWRSWEHLSFEQDVKCPLESRKEWTHVNSIRLTPDADLLISFRHTDTILDFFSFMVGAAERLPNGTTFITAGAFGHLFEITPTGERVWDYTSPYVFDSPFGPTPAIFRAHRYAGDAPCLAGRDLSPTIDPA